MGSHRVNCSICLAAVEKIKQRGAKIGFRLLVKIAWHGLSERDVMAFEREDESSRDPPDHSLGTP